MSRVSLDSGLCVGPPKSPLTVRRMRLVGRQPARFRFTKASDVPGGIEVRIQLEATSYAMEMTANSTLTIDPTTFRAPL